jgi:hypothetical protein
MASTFYLHIISGVVRMRKRGRGVWSRTIMAVLLVALASVGLLLGTALLPLAYRVHTASAGTPNDNPPIHAPGHSAFITNGTILLGINNEGHLNLVPGAEDNIPPSAGGTVAVGLRFLPTGNEATAPGCLCEGWGVGDGGTGVSGFASVDNPGGIANNVALESFSATESTAVSVVTVGGVFRVTHDFHPIAVTPFLYEVTVTIENISGRDLSDVRYRRLMDWDVEPTPTSEFVTINSGTAEDLALVTDNGFDSPDPLAPPTLGGFTEGDRVDDGPRDHGALFQFEFGTLPAGEKLVFNIYYGGAASEVEALAALAAVNAEAFSLGQPSGPDGATLGVPNTFIFGFSGIGGASIVGDIVLDPPQAVNDVGTTHTITAIVQVEGEAVSNTDVVFTVTAGPNRGKTETITSDGNGQAIFTYTGDQGPGSDEIEVSFISPGTDIIIRRQASKKWATTFGDLNGDGVRDLQDAQDLLQRLVRFETVSLIADMDGNGILTNRDSILIAGVEAERIPTPPDVRRLDSRDNEDGTFSIIGAPGAVPSGAAVRLTNTQTNTLATAPIASDGSFGPVTIAATPGDRLTLDVDNSPARVGGVRPFPLDIPNNFTVGNKPAAVASGDVNGDTILDLVTANSGANSLSILLGNNDGTFQDAATIAVSASPAAVVLIDLNGDNHLDLVVANQGAVAVLLSNGNGTFQDAKNFTVGSAPKALVVDDFNNDTQLDLAIADAGANHVFLLLGDGDGSFNPTALSTDIGGRSTALAAGHLNDDALLDLVVANTDANSIAILLGNGDGTFQIAPRALAGLHPAAVVLQEVNGDSRLDLVVANRGSNDVSVLFGNGDGTFRAARHYPVDGRPVALVMVDFNADSKLDIVVANKDASNVEQLLGDGTGNFHLPIFSHQAGNAPTALVIGDFNDDSRLDVAVANELDNTVSVLLTLPLTSGLE